MAEEPLETRSAVRSTHAHRPALVHIVEDIERHDPSGEGPERGRLEAGEGFLEFCGASAILRMTPVRDISVGDGRVVVAYGERRISHVSFGDARDTSPAEAPGASLAGKLREIVGLPPLPATTPQRVAGKAWSCVGTGVMGGFMLGFALGGGRRLGLMDFLEILWGGGGFVLATPVLAYQMGRKARVPAFVTWSLAAAAISAGTLLGMSGPPELAVIGLILLGLVLATAAALTTMRFAPV